MPMKTAPHVPSRRSDAARWDSEGLDQAAFMCTFCVYVFVMSQVLVALRIMSFCTLGKCTLGQINVVRVRHHLRSSLSEFVWICFHVSPTVAVFSVAFVVYLCCLVVSGGVMILLVVAVLMV